MTPKQTALYWREWRDARLAGGLQESERYTVMEEALGEHKSSKDLTNDDLDKVLAAFRKISRPTDLNAQLHALTQPRARLLHGLQTAADTAYRQHVMNDRFGHSDLDRLTLEQLQQLLMTLKARARTRPRAQLVEDPF